MSKRMSFLDSLRNVLDKISVGIGLKEGGEEYVQPEDEYTPMPEEESEPEYTSASYVGSSGYAKAGGYIPKASPRKVPKAPETLTNSHSASSPMHEEKNSDSGKVLQMPVSGARTASAQTARSMPETRIMLVRSKRDTEQIILYLREGMYVLLNFEEVDEFLFQQVLDMVSGAAFALNAYMTRVATRCYLVAPEGVTVKRSEDLRAVR